VSKIQGFLGGQYRRVYLKRMHESLKDCSERILAGVVYHTSLAIVQPWKN